MVGTRGLRAGFAAASATVLLGVPAGAAAASGPADRSATRSYLEARYRLIRSEAAGTSTAAAAAVDAADLLGSECAGVLSRAPSQSLGELFRSEAVSARRVGEVRRQRDQLNTIEDEAEGLVFATFEAPYAAAKQTFAAAVTPLTWTDPRIAEAVRAEAALISAKSAEAPSAACADMRGWAASGFQSLASGSRALRSQTNIRLEGALGPRVDVEAVLQPFESKADHALVRRTELTELARFRAYIAVSKSIGRLHTRLGLRDLNEPRGKPPKRLGHGRTQAGGTFTVTTEQSLGHRLGCRLEVSVEYERKRKTAFGFLTGRGGETVCVAGRNAQRTSHLEGCEQGMLTITAATPGASSVRLLLADGRTITSPTVFVSKRYGGPAWVYAQSLGRKSSPPVSLTELDSEGRVVAIVRLRPHGRCPVATEVLPKPLLLARGTAPDGRPYAIEAAYFAPAGIHGETQLTISLVTPEGGLKPFVGTPHKEFQPQIAHECAPHEFGIVYGQLRAPATAASVRTAAGVQALSVVGIPAFAHPTGKLAYAVFTSPPLELIVAGSGGKTLFTESLAKATAEQREFCEGYAEP